jgi:RNA polymerase subunit RPABC4/transcription elongation factor Spt4
MIDDIYKLRKSEKTLSCPSCYSTDLTKNDDGTICNDCGKQIV